MDVFITGASGYVGGVVAERLRAAGHTVRALARSDRAAETVTALGATPVRGDLRSAEVLRAAADHADAVVHAAVDYTDPAMAEAEAAGLRAMLASAAGKPFVYTSTGLVYPGAGDTPRTEDDPVDEATSAQPHKVAGERAVLAAPGVTAIVLRAALVHGRGGSGLLQGLLAMGRGRGVVPYIGDGAQIWSSVHVDDLADLFVLAVQRPRAGVYNAAAPDAFPLRRLAEALAERAGAVATSLPLDAAAAIAPQLAVLGRSGALDGARARATFDWRPHRPDLLADLRGAAYAAA